MVLQVVKKLKCFDRYPMYVKRELAKVLYYDMFEKGRVVIKQGALFHQNKGESNNVDIKLTYVTIYISTKNRSQVFLVVVPLHAAFMTAEPLLTATSV